MKKRFVFCFIIIAVIMLLSSCSPGAVVPSPTPAVSPSASAAAPTPTARPAPTAAPTAAPTPVPVPLPAITLGQGDNYFSVDGRQSFIFSRNVAGFRQQDYTGFIDWAKTGGSSVVRLQLNAISQGYTGTGKVDEAWALEWDKVIDAARAKGIYVLPVFSSWFEWNAGDNPYSDYSTWNQNKFNEALGGPAKSPAELFKEGSATRTAWLEWVKALVNRWKGRDNIIAWEIFSEVNFISGAKEPKGVEFINTAAAMIRSVDPGRPVTASIADTDEWKVFYRDADIDFIQVHPYPPFALDKFELELVRKYLGKYNKPVLVGESGFAGNPEEYNEGNITSDRHAVWARVVSGEMNWSALY